MRYSRTIASKNTILTISNKKYIHFIEFKREEFSVLSYTSI